MKLTILAIALVGLTQTASAWTCYNTAEWVDGEWLYTSSLCPNQKPAPQHILDSMSYSANNPDVGQIDPSYPAEVVQGVTYTTSVNTEEYRLRRLEGDGLAVESRYVTFTTVSGSDGSVVITETYDDHTVINYYQNGTTVSHNAGSSNKTTDTHNWGLIKSGNAADKVTSGWVSITSIFKDMLGVK